LPAFGSVTFAPLRPFIAQQRPVHQAFVTVTVTAVPEPSTSMTLAIASCPAAVAACRRRKA